MAEAEKTRYSDAELEEFKQLILKKLETARADYELLRATITHTASNDTEDTSPTFKVLEEGATTPLQRGERPPGRPSNEIHPQPQKWHSYASRTRHTASAKPPAS